MGAWGRGWSSHPGDIEASWRGGSFESVTQGLCATCLSTRPFSLDSSLVSLSNLALLHSLSNNILNSLICKHYLFKQARLSVWILFSHLQPWKTSIHSLILISKVTSVKLSLKLLGRVAGFLLPASGLSFNFSIYHVVLLR